LTPHYLSSPPTDPIVFGVAEGAANLRGNSAKCSARVVIVQWQLPQQRRPGTFIKNFSTCIRFRRLLYLGLLFNKVVCLHENRGAGSKCVARDPS
jgi:hypothetical protein